MRRFERVAASVPAALLFAAIAFSAGPLPAEESGGQEKKDEGSAGRDAPPGGTEGDGGEGEKQAPPDPPELVLAMKTLEKANARVRTMTVPYVQHRKVRISKKIRKAAGMLRLEKRPAPEGLRILFEETSPHRMKLLFTDEKVVFRDMESDKVEVHDPRKGGIRPSEIWILGRPIADIRKSFGFALGLLDAEAAKSFSAMLKLTPKKKEVAKWVKEMHVWLSAKDGLPVKVRIVDPKDEYQEFTFDTGKMELNLEIDPALFDVEGKPGR